MSLPPFPTDESTLDLLWTALNPGPESELTSVLDLLEFMSELGGSDPYAVSEVIDDGSAHAPRIVLGRDPVYSINDVLRALIVALREARAQIPEETA